MTLNLATLLRESATKSPEHPAIVVGETTLPYGAVHDLAKLFGGALTKHGVDPGDHVALMLPNVPHFTIAYFGTFYAGGAVVPLNVLLKADEIAYHLEDSAARAIVVWEGFYDEARAAFDRVAGCKHIIVARADRSDTSAPDGALSMTAISGAATPRNDLPATMPDDTAVILYTSGTTGRPKGAELTHFNMFFNCDYVRTHLTPMPIGEDGEPEKIVALATLPLFHSFGQTVVQNATLRGGGTVVLLPRFEPVAAAQAIQENQVNLFAGVPTMYFALLHSEEVKSYRMDSLKHCMSGGAAMPTSVMQAFDDKYGVNILEGYGLSETSPVASFNPPGRPKKAGTIGLPIDGVEFRLEDEEGNVVTTPGESGEICIKGHNVMKGYWKNDAATAESIRDGWFHSGDIGTRDEEGYYTIVDRKKDLIIRGGMNVYPREVEEILYAHPAIAEAAVIGVPDDAKGEEIRCVVAFKPGKSATAEEIIAHCKSRVAAYKYPRSVQIVDALPKTATGKILKREIPRE